MNLNDFTLTLHHLKICGLFHSIHQMTFQNIGKFHIIMNVVVDVAIHLVSVIGDLLPAVALNVNVRVVTLLFAQLLELETGQLRVKVVE